MTEWLTYELTNKGEKNMWGKIAALVLLGLSVVNGIYKAGKYANGGKDVTEGGGAAVASFIGATISGIVVLALYLGV